MSKTEPVPTANLADVLRDIVAEKPPSAQRNAVYEELRKHDRAIKAAIQGGWSASQLASRMRDRGVKASEERLRTEIRKIAGLPATTKKKP
jgi:hypothetical protein